MEQGKITLAVADDHGGYRTAICGHLDRMGFDICIEASNGNELIQRLEQCALLPDLIIVDVSMRVMDGITATKLIHGRWPAVFILAMSFNDDPAIVASIVAAGAHRFMLKGEDPEELKNTIHALLKK